MRACFRVRGQRPLQNLFGFLAFAKLAMGVREANQGLQHPRIGIDHLVEVRYCFSRLTRAVEAKSQIVAVKDVIGLCLDGLHEALYGNGVIFACRRQCPKQIERLGMIGVVPQYELVEILRLFVLSSLLKRKSPLQKV